MKMSRTAIKELTAAYRAVLKHAFIAAMGAMVVIGGASADDTKTRLVVDVDATENLAGVHDGYITQEFEQKGNVADVAGTLNVAAGSEFINNKSDYIGGAILARKRSGVTLNIGENTIFDNNMAKYDGGAIGNYQAAIIGKNVIFRNNHANIGIDGRELTADDNPIGGGAISMGVDATLDLTGGIFENNTSGYDGGAIGTRRTLQKKEVAGFDDLVNYIKIADSRFTGNQATGKTSDIANGKKVGGNGGAIANTFATTEISGTTFTKNTAAANGGAIYNHTFINVDAEGTDTGLGGVMTIRDSVFSENSAKQGGAIYNATGGAVTLAGENTFTGNMAGGVGNDIHNLGKLTVSGGTTTIDGGITGDGALTIAGGATLNIGTTTVQQKELTLDGTVGATIIGANNYGKLLAETYKGNGKVSLNVATTGTYNIFGENANEYTVVDAGAIYDVTKGDNGAVTIATKKVEEIAAGAGLTNTAANTVAALANADNDLANIASLNVQQALRNGDTDYIETESAKANPVDKPVVQSVAQSVQGAVMTLTANRMAGAPSAGTMGRSGGDLSDADYGVWAQGMFNKSKFNGQFNGYTRGVSAGFDALIDKQYTIGLGYAFGHSDVHANGGRDTEIDSNSIFAYAQYKPSEWFVNAALNYTMSKYTETVDAFGVRLKSDHDTDAFGGQVMTGYDFASGLTPEIGLRYLHVTQDSYNNGLNHVSSDDTDFLTGIAGMKYRFAIENDSVINWFPELRAAATYDFVSDRAMSTVTMPGAAAYVVDGDRLSRFGGEFGIGLTAEYNGLEISLVYDLNLHKDYTSQTGMAKFRYEF